MSRPADPKSFEGRMLRALALPGLSPHDEERAKVFSGGTGVRKRAAVLALFAEAETEDPALLFLKRSSTVGQHRGQIAFPGGRVEVTDADLQATALREAHEEVGISGSEVKVWGSLAELWTVSDYWVTPFVGCIDRSVAEVALVPDPEEVESVFWVRWSELSHRDVYVHEWVQQGAIRFRTHVFYVGPERQWRIWGATGAMVKNLLDRWHSLG